MRRLVAVGHQTSTWALLAAALGLYWVAEYFLIYRPLIVPKLSSWPAIPMGIHAATWAPFIVGLGILGSVSRWPGIALAALLLGLIDLGFANVMYRRQMPGFVKAELVDSLIWSLLTFAVHVAGLTAVMAFGLLAGTKLRVSALYRA